MITPNLITDAICNSSCFAFQKRALKNRVWLSLNARGICHVPGSSPTALKRRALCRRAWARGLQRVTGLTSQKAHNRKQLQAEQLLSFRAFISFPSGRMQREGAKNANTMSISVPQDTRSGHSQCVTCQTRLYLVDKKLLSHFSPNSKAAQHLKQIY